MTANSFDLDFNAPDINDATEISLKITLRKQNTCMVCKNTVLPYKRNCRNDDVNSLTRFPLEDACMGNRHCQTQFKYPNKYNCEPDVSEEKFFAQQIVEYIFDSKFLEFANQCVCHGCFEKKILEKLEKPTMFYHRKTTLHITCPFCNVAPINSDYLTIKIRQQVKSALDLELERRTRPSFHCPVKNCYFEQVFRDGNTCTNCPRHGDHCLKCWKKVGLQDHDCKGCPEELVSVALCKDLVSCPKCNITMVKEDGCSRLTCLRCNYEWRQKLESDVYWTAPKEGAQPIVLEDVQLVMSQTQSTQIQAEAALKYTKGDIVEAIMHLTV